MTDTELNDSMFPAFRRMVERVPALKNPRGAFFKRLPRILGQGRTRARNFDAPPSPWERQLELVNLQLPTGVTYSEDVAAEIDAARAALEEVRASLATLEGRRRFAEAALARIPLPEERKGLKDDTWFAGRLVLLSGGGGLGWSWGLTVRHAVISDLPPDVDYVARAYPHAEAIVSESLLEPEAFAERLQLALRMTRAINGTRQGEVALCDVERMFRLASQRDRFWSSPSRANFVDVPESVFVANFMVHSNDDLRRRFELIPARREDLKKALYLPTNPEGTAVAPFVAIRTR